MKTDVWLRKVKPRKDNELMPQSAFPLGGGSAMTDGWRIHCAPEPCQGEPFAEEESVLDYLTQQLPTEARLTTDPLLHASKAAVATDSGLLSLSLNGCAQIEAHGQTLSTQWDIRNGDKWQPASKHYSILQYSKIGPDAALGLDPRFLRDAVSGMGHVVTIGMCASFVRITDGERVAVIMGKGG